MERHILPLAENKANSKRTTRRYSDYIDHRTTTAGRGPKFGVSAPPDVKLPRTKPGHEIPPNHKGDNNPRIPIQDRRKQPRKLRIPLDMLELPSRSRPPATDPRSPTQPPWVTTQTQNWHDVGLADAKWTIHEHIDAAGFEFITPPVSLPGDLHEKQPKHRLSLSRVRYGKQRSSGTSTSTEGSKRSHFLHRRWSGPHWQLHSGFSSSTPSPDKSPSSVHQDVKPKYSRSSIRSSNRHSHPPQQKSNWRRKRSHLVRSESYIEESMANLPAVGPPSAPPEVLVPTVAPQGEVKGQLANFLFDAQEGVGDKHRSPKATERQSIRIWDSDALLMSLPPMRTPSSENEELAQGPLDARPTDNHAITPNDDSSPFRQVPFPSPPEGNTKKYWFRVPNPAGEGKRDGVALGRAEEIARLEWITPEHLPTSPLCPLHEKYRGENKGFCVYHSRLDGALPSNNRREKPESAIVPPVLADVLDLDMVEFSAATKRESNIRRESVGIPALRMEGGGVVKSRRSRAEVESST